ncbi:hypothetical protein ACTQZK_05655 [Paraeggerthella sp. LCP19S3_G8]|uniref:hypothetical protein n=1 Tax=Paraeggerthella sp. LCP19S3_G8 TaxID=3440248 RepID=UPI002A8BD530|nr:hypothetical protein [Paraeggerthella sp.]
MKKHALRLAAQGRAIILVDASDLKNMEDGLSLEEYILLDKVEALIKKTEDGFRHLC